MQKGAIVRLAILAIALLSISPIVFAKEAENDLQWVIEEVRDTRTTGDWSRLEILTQVKTSLLKDVKRKRLQITKAEDNLGNDLKPESFNKYHLDFSGMGKNLPTIQLASPPRKATHINIEGILELFIPDLDPEAKGVIPNLGEKLQKIGYYIRLNYFPSTSEEPSQLQKYGLSIKIGKSVHPNAKPRRRHEIHVQITDEYRKVLDVVLTDKEGKEIMAQGGSWTADRTQLGYRFYADPAGIVDLVIYFKSDKAIKTIPLEYKNIPLP